MGIRRRLYERWHLRRQLRRLTFQHEYQRQDARDRINGIAVMAASEMARIAAEERRAGGLPPDASRRPAGGADYIDGEAWEVP
jgi:hypothetical protein